jgi:malate dehydrogenase (oxaloacetate-decarboxylating)(NADP+)
MKATGNPIANFEGGVTLAGLINALKITGGRIEEQKVLFLGAGSAAIGLADLIVAAKG